MTADSYFQCRVTSDIKSRLRMEHQLHSESRLHTPGGPSRICAFPTQFCVDKTQICVQHAQMRVRRLTAADVCEVTGYNRDQLRSLLKELPDWSAAPGERKAREYLAHDLIVLSVVHTLDVVIGIRRRSIGSVFPQLRKALSGPKPMAASARLLITFVPLRVDYFDGKAAIPEGVVVSLQSIFDRVDRYLGSAQVASVDTQAHLRLGPGLVRMRRRRGAV
jgi:hypothetical protein